ncbi:MAG: terminase, partial [Gemmataceae bacterium]
MPQIEADRAKLQMLDAELLALDRRLWIPLPGPQEEAYDSPADELFFGGAAGPGKTQLLLGLAYTKHRRAIVFRREYSQLREIIEQTSHMIGTNGAYNTQEHIWRLRDGRRIEFGSVPHESDVRKYQGRPHDLIAFDELPEFTRNQYQFLLGWNRTDDPRQRCRVVAAGNPPTAMQMLGLVVQDWAQQEALGDLTPVA